MPICTLVFCFSSLARTVIAAFYWQHISLLLVPFSLTAISFNLPSSHSVSAVLMQLLQKE